MKLFILLYNGGGAKPYNSTQGVPEKAGLILIGLFLIFAFYLAFMVWRKLKGK